MKVRMGVLNVPNAFVCAGRMHFAISLLYVLSGKPGNIWRVSIFEDFGRYDVEPHCFGPTASYAFKLGLAPLGDH